MGRRRKCHRRHVVHGRQRVGASIVTKAGQVTAVHVGIANQGAEQCGFCNPGFIMNAIALFRENPNPSDEEILEYLAGNLCRCSGYEGQLRGIRAFLDYKNGITEEQA